jgi:hypothetical protein
MPGCVLRVLGDAFQSESFLAGGSLTPCNVFRKGEPKAKERVWETSGMTISVSDASGDNFVEQVQDAIRFLNVNENELARLRKHSGLEAMSLDFGVNRKDGFLQSSFFPPDLISLAASLGIGIELSIYGDYEG